MKKATLAAVLFFFSVAVFSQVVNTIGKKISEKTNLRNGYCIPGGDCSNGNCFTDFSFAGIVNLNSGCSQEGYGDFTEITGNVTMGNTYTAFFSVAYPYQMVSMWVDFNNDTVFSDSERIITDFLIESYNIMVPVSGIYIPNNTLPGEHRLRIGCCYGAPSSTDPCAIVYPFGEWEDYTLEVSGVPINFDAVAVSIDMDSISLPGEIIPKATVMNNGVENISFPVTCTIGNYSSTIQVTDLSLGEQIQVEFDPWEATDGTYSMEICTQLEGDEIIENDCLTQNVYILVTDAGVSEINMSSAIQPGDIYPQVKVKNFGFETVGFPVTATVEECDYSSTVEVANLAPGEEITVYFDLWSSTPGTYHMEICTALSPDGNPEDDCKSKTILVSEEVRQKVIMELATGTWCTWCPYAEAGADELYQEFSSNLAVIEWHYNDEFETSQSVERIVFYGITGLPTTEFDGVLEYLGGDPPSSYPYFLPLFQQRLETPSNFGIGIQIQQIDGTDYNVTTTWTINDGSNSENLSAFVILTETDCASAGNDNQNFVGRKIYPDINGTPLDFSAQSVFTLNHTVTVEEGWVPENCEMIAFLQNMDTKEIYQGNSVMLVEAYVGTDDAVSSEPEISIYPNPVHDVVNIVSGERIRYIDMFSHNGELVFDGPVNSSVCNLGVGRFQRGLYLLRITTNAGVTVKRILVE